jgi:DNA-binding MarR family transcriptional regulator
MALTDKELQTWITFLRSHAALTAKLAHVMHQEHGMPISWYDVLVHLYHAPGQRLRMQDLADAVILSSSGLTRLLDRMVETGLIDRIACAEDRRVIFAALTEEGAARLEDILPHHQARIKEYFAAHLTKSELDTIQEALQRVLNAAQTECDACVE